MQALHITRKGRTLLERYGVDFDRAVPHALYSGAKSFWGVVAAAAVDDGLLTLDETVGATVPEWNAGERAAVTLRELLQLTSGLGFGGLGSSVPSFERALETPLKNPPGSTFTYGGTSLQIFGAVLQRKLASRKLTPHGYLHERILDPVGVKISAWRKLADGTQPLPTGAFMSADQWLKYGRFLAAGGVWKGVTLVSAESFAACFTGSSANPRYGLGFWLSPLATQPDLSYASGSGGQALYVQPSSDLVVVKFGESASYKHDAFLRLLFDEPRPGRRVASLQQASQAG